MEKKTLKATIDGHYAPITCLVIHTKSSILISGSQDQTIKGWNLEKLKKNNFLVGSNNEIYAIVAVSMPEASYVISAGKDKYIRIWQKNSILKDFMWEGQSIVCSLAVNRNMTNLACGRSDGTISLYNINSKKDISLPESIQHSLKLGKFH